MVWQGQGQWQGGSVEFEFLSLFLKSKDYYRILEVDDDATEDVIRSNYLRLALKWHPDKQQDEDSAKSKFQEINEAYKVLSDPIKRREYDVNRVCDVQDYNFMEYLHRFKGLILTCNGLGMGSAPRWWVVRNPTVEGDFIQSTCCTKSSIQGADLQDAVHNFFEQEMELVQNHKNRGSL